MTSADAEGVHKSGLATRSRGKLFALAAATVLAIYLCYRLAYPFMPALVWAITAAVVTRRFSGWVGARVGSSSLKAGICVSTIAVAFLLPAIWLGYVATQQIVGAIEQLQKPETQENLQQWLEDHPRLQRGWTTVARDFDLAKDAPPLFDRMRPGAVAAIYVPLYVAAQALLTLFILFYLYRDERRALDAFRRMLPLNNEETNRLLGRLDDTIHATIYGTVVVAIIQGALGGAMFGILGLPAALLWGIVMGVLAIVPYLGAFIVWAPAAALLAMQDQWGKALLLTAWGTIVVGLIDNLIYPILVGGRLRQHTVIAFIAIIGGISVFGATGLVLGPVVVSSSFFLLDLWRTRTEHGATAERA
jgi:predicted PurR-regulated permease PerM